MARQVGLTAFHVGMSDSTPRRLRAVVLDLDGTLLDSHKRVPAANARAVEGLKAIPGMLVVFATARPPRATLPLLGGLERGAFVACYNGAVTLRDGNLVSRTMIPEHAVRSLMGSLLERFPRLARGLELDDEMYSVGHFDRHFPREYRGCLKPSELPFGPTPKILIDIPDASFVDPVKALLPPECSCVLTDHGGLLQVVARDVSKRAAVGALIAAQGIGWDEVVCFGDDLNDLSLFEACGRSVAMANAHGSLKARATHHTLSNDECGVAAALKLHLPLLGF